VREVRGQRAEGRRANKLCAVTIGIMFFLYAVFSILPCGVAEEYKFDAAEVEKKPYQLGGYLEFYPILFGQDKNASLYKLAFVEGNGGKTPNQYNGTLQLEGSLEAGISSVYVKTNTRYSNSPQDETTRTTVFEGNLSLKPSTSLSIDLGKKTLNWGKGYAWNPAAFLDRPKNPDDPELSREGFIVASTDYTKSFQGPLKTLSFTPVLLPVYGDVNDDFGETGRINGAAKLYLLLFDTDIDLMFFAGGSRTTRYGFDFSRNITANLEVHGEFSWVNGFTKTVIDMNGNTRVSTFPARNYLFGARYLSEQDTTYILEYYGNGTGFSGKELRDFFSFVDTGYETYRSTGNSGALNKAAGLFQGPYGKINPGTNYLYARVSQKEPFDILYFTPAVTLIVNTSDRSFSFMPEVMYTGITNLELRLRTGFIGGAKGSEYGEKQNDYRMDFRARYYF
jgi:hypothetical protein